MAKQEKPKCGKGQSCGYACIEAADTCTETVDSVIATRMLDLVFEKQWLSPGGQDRQSTFEELSAKFKPYWDGPWSPSQGFQREDLGDGLSVERLVFRSNEGRGDEELVAVVGRASDGRQFVLSDGLVKEVTSADTDAIWQEAVDAAIRRRLSGKPAVAILAAAKARKAKVIDAEDYNRGKDAGQDSSIKPYKVERELGSGGSGEAFLTDRGTVVKRLNRNADFEQEVNGARVLGESGAGPKLLGYNSAAREIEMEQAAGASDKSRYDTEQDLVARELIKLHRTGHTHGDLKSDNVIFDGDRARLIDGGWVDNVKKGMLSAEGRANTDQDGALSGFEELKYALPNSSIASQVSDYLEASGAIQRHKDSVSQAYFSENSDAKIIRARVKLHQEYIEALRELGL